MAPIPWARARLPIARVAKAESSVASASLRYFAIIFGLLRYLAASKAGPLAIGQPTSQLFPIAFDPRRSPSFAPLQLSLSPMFFLPRRIEHPLDVPITYLRSIAHQQMIATTAARRYAAV